MITARLRHIIASWSITLAFLAFMTANVVAFVVIDNHHDEAVEWQDAYCKSLKSGRHELRVLVAKLEEVISNERVREDLADFLASYPEIECQ